MSQDNQQEQKRFESFIQSAKSAGLSNDAAMQIFSHDQESNENSLTNWEEFQDKETAAAAVGDMMTVQPTEYQGKEMEFIRQFFPAYLLPNGGVIILWGADFS
jgi:hypothetical protein